MRRLRGYSSAGRATALQAVGQEFEPPYLHQKGMDTLENKVYFLRKEVRDIRDSE